MAENFSKINDNKSQIQKGQNTPRTINTKMSIAMHIIFKLLKNKKDKPQKKIVKEARGGEKKKQILYLKRNKVKNYSGLFVRSCKEEESGVKYLKY